MVKNCLTCHMGYGNTGKFCPYDGCGDLSCIGSSSKWQPIKEDKVKYKLTEKYKDGFSLVDIAKRRPCWDEFIKLIENEVIHHAEKCGWGRHWSHNTKRTSKNIDWLIEKGFIEEEAEEWVNLYYSSRSMDMILSSLIYSTEEGARNGVAQTWDYIKTIRIK